MGKETYYFSHDYNARNDPKIRKLISRHGITGYGIFWAIVEDLYQNANALPTDYDLIAFDMRTECDIVKSIVNDFDLFVIEGDEFGSLAVERRLTERNEKSGKARESAFKRWNKNKQDANALQSHSEPNAIKESKVNKSKVNKTKEEIIYPSDKFKEIWLNWIDYKKNEFRESYKTVKSEQIAFNNLLNLANGNEQTAEKIIGNSIANHYKGIFPIKTEPIVNGSPQKPITIKDPDWIV